MRQVFTAFRPAVMPQLPEAWDLRWWAWRGWIPVLAMLQWAVLTVLFLKSGEFIRQYDPTAGLIGGDVINALILCLLIVDSFAVGAWLLMQLIKKSIIKNVSACLETKICLLSYWGLVLLFVWVFSLVV